MGTLGTLSDICEKLRAKPGPTDISPSCDVALSWEASCWWAALRPEMVSLRAEMAMVTVDLLPPVVSRAEPEVWAQVGLFWAAEAPTATSQFGPDRRARLSRSPMMMVSTGSSSTLSLRWILAT